jgi:two-component system OmpR family sensor kinase
VTSPVGMHTSLVTRTVVMTSAVAAIVVLVAGLVAYPLVRASALTQTQGTLARLTDLTAAALERGPQASGRGEILPRSLTEILLAEQVTGYVVVAGGVSAPGMTPEETSALVAGRSFSKAGEVADGPVLIEGRPLATGGAVVLEQPISVVGGSAKAVVLRLAAALVIGLLIAIPIGYIVARRMTRPLRAARDAANEMAAGSRDVQLTPRGPSEIAEIAVSLNHLSSALAVSEGRQRDFLLSVSHEFRTPLTAVKGYAEALADGVVPGDDVARTGATMGAEAERLDRLVSDLLDLARLGAVNFRMHPIETDLLEIGKEAAGVWRDRCSREQVTFIAEFGDAPVPLTTDPMRLRQVIDNLTENALRVSPAGSLIVLAVRAEPGWAVVEVRDSGPGLTDDDIAVAFEPGVLHERYRGVRPVGTGLGLAMVGRLAAGLGGYAEAGAAREGGARFTVRLPATQPAES